MPTYEYECKACGHSFAHFQGMSEEPLAACPECGGKLHRLIGSGAGVIFKGSGFYSTDYKNASTKCGRNRPCCGRDAPCDSRPCGD